MGCSGRRCCVDGRRVLVARMDTREHRWAEGNPARRNRGRSGVGSDLRREVPEPGRCTGEIGGVQQSFVMEPAIGHREGRLGYHAWKRYTEFGSCERLRRKAWQLDLKTRPYIGLRRALMTGATGASFEAKGN